jgi:glycosyltransferase involved in cell wall biosynthesis
MISVCLATYNGVEFLEEQINSIVLQLNDNDELIISDDGSTDGTLDIITKINDKRVKLFNHVSKIPKKIKSFDIHTINHYISFNFENAIRHSKGDVIFFSDQDDIWYPHKIKTSISALENNDMVISNFSIIDNNGNILIEKYRKGKPFIDNYILMAFKPEYTGCAMAFKRKVLDYILPFPKDISFGHDNWAGLCVTKFGKIEYIDEPLFYHRIHNKNNSGLAGKSPNNILQKINLRMCLLFNILARKRGKVQKNT